MLGVFLGFFFPVVYNTSSCAVIKKLALLLIDFRNFTALNFQKLLVISSASILGVGEYNLNSVWTQSAEYLLSEH